MASESALKVIMKPNGGGELTPLLCDAQGEPLPGQVSVKIETAVDQNATVTVTFCAIKFAADEDASQPAPAGDKVLTYHAIGRDPREVRA